MPEEQRAARFQCVLVYLRHADDPTPIICQGTWEGRILNTERGEAGFGYDPGHSIVKARQAGLQAVLYKPFRLDQLIEWCEARDLHVSWNVWFHSFLSQTVWGEGNDLYRNNPYRLVAEAVDFYGSGEAWEYQEKLYRYMIECTTRN